ncbi:hypothetical protein, partial [Paraburkholderia sp. SIMBA_027]
GSFAFSKTSAFESGLVLPEIVVGIRDGKSWLTQLTLDDVELTEAGALAALAGWLRIDQDDDASPFEDLSPVTADGTATLASGSLS